MSRKIIIAIDGPSASGKSTVGRRLAERLGYCYIDTGAMYRVAALKAKELSIDMDDEEKLTKVTVDQIQKKVSDFYQIRFSELIGRRRTSEIVFPRQVAMYISRTLTSDPLKSIGEAFGGRDHGTVIHACKQVENMMDQDGSVKRGVDYLIKQLSKGSV